MTARSSSAEMQRADQVAARVLGDEELIGKLWNLLSFEQRFAVATLYSLDDLRYVLGLSWQQIETRDRMRLVAGFRHLMGLSSLAEAALP